MVSLLGVEGTAGRAGSVLEEGDGLPGWFGFHIFLYFLSLTSELSAPETTLRVKIPHVEANFGGAALLKSRPTCGSIAIHKPRNPCSCLHLNHGWRKIEIPMLGLFIS
jgi:hypothetical protein